MARQETGPERPRVTTLADVAEAAGVAVSTVSRAFSRPGRVNSRTLVHVHEVATRLGYRPNQAARALGSGKTSMLGLVVSDITNPHFFTLIRGAERQASAAGYTLILGDTQQSPRAEREVVDRALGSVDGLLIAASRLRTSELRAYAADKAVVLVNREAEGISSVVTDHTEGPRQLVGHLHSLGHRGVVFLSGPRESWSGAKRWAAIDRTARELGMSAIRLGPFPPSIEGGPAAADAAIGTRATAVIAHNDLLAIGILRRLAERGIDVPGQVSVAGFDDIFGADFCTPPLTTVAAPLEDAGRVAVELLLQARPPVKTAAQRLVVPSHLKIRQSSGPAGEQA
ncbi:LacI family DNA-binding transcriptional regulator [Amycolatopsis sp. MEPSY49]|uniref:LacI family DNA-binding transcriptional regulator n=1 Tax=Amycolatopsis sp. MEPSY49 TaxID=3151600 RepID=UPI003EFA1F59